MRARFNIARVQAAMDRGSAAALELAGEALLQEANRTIPLEEGTLARSGAVDNDEKRAHVYYVSRYAVRQHEDMTYRHAPRRRAKWLERTAVERRDLILRQLAQGFRGKL